MCVLYTCKYKTILKTINQNQISIRTCMYMSLSHSEKQFTCNKQLHMI